MASSDKVQLLDWSMPFNLVGEKIEDPPLHGCEVCDMPILYYGRMIPCKHVFCYDCAQQSSKACPRCNDPVGRIERCDIGQVYLCTDGAPKHSYECCRRTYLSQRDLDAHVSHRHKPPQPPSHHSDTSQAGSKRGNLITIQIQNSKK